MNWETRDWIIQMTSFNNKLEMEISKMTSWTTMLGVRLTLLVNCRNIVKEEESRCQGKQNNFPWNPLLFFMYSRLSHFSLPLYGNLRNLLFCAVLSSFKLCTLLLLSFLSISSFNIANSFNFTTNFQHPPCIIFSIY